MAKKVAEPKEMYPIYMPKKALDAAITNFLLNSLEDGYTGEELEELIMKQAEKWLKSPVCKNVIEEAITKLLSPEALTKEVDVFIHQKSNKGLSLVEKVIAEQVAIAFQKGK